MKEMSREELLKRVEVLEKRVAELEGSVQEQPEEEFVTKTKESSLFKNKGTIHISGGELLSKDKRKSLVKEIDTVIGKYTENCYGLHLIITKSK